MVNAVLNMVSQLILILIFNYYSGYDKETVVSEDHEGNLKIRTSQVSSDLDVVEADFNESDVNTTGDKLKPTFRSSKPQLVETTEEYPSQETESKNSKDGQSRISEKIELACVTDQ